MAAAKMTPTRRSAKEVLQIVVVGKTSSGKSSLCNHIMTAEKLTPDREIFKSSVDFTSETWHVQAGSVTVGSREFLIVDTPGLVDTRIKNEKQSLQTVARNMKKAVEICSGEIDCFLFVLRPDVGFTKEEASIAKTLELMFGAEFLAKYCFLVFTHKDAVQKILKRRNLTSLDEWCRRQKGELGELLRKCRFRYCFVNNLEPCQEQREEILNAINEIKDINGENRYTHARFQENKKNRIELLEEANLPEITDSIIKRYDVVQLKLQQMAISPSTFENLVELTGLKETAEDLLCELNELTVSTPRLEKQKKDLKQMIEDTKKRMKSLETSMGFFKAGKAAASFLGKFVLPVGVGIAGALAAPYIGLPFAAGAAASAFAGQTASNAYGAYTEYKAENEKENDYQRKHSDERERTRDEERKKRDAEYSDI